MADQRSRKRRYVKRIALLIAIPLALLWAYLGCFLLVRWAFYNGHRMYAEPVMVLRIWEPIKLYEESGLPLSFDLMTLDVWCSFRGDNMTWSRAKRNAEYNLQARRIARDQRRRIGDPTGQFNRAAQRSNRQ